MVASAGLDSGLRHFLYGGSPGVAHGAGRRLEQLVPGVQVVGTAAPPFASIDEWPVADLRQDLERTKPDILWVGLGAPKQELWMQAMSDVLDVPVMVGVGAAFDYLAGTVSAAPDYLRHVGLEWLFRLAVEPKRLWRRYLVGNSTFVYLVLRDELSRPVRRHGS
jgi:N-acetylglucosaminyldiphosphoundecaprenol N-acetyl-beta-D-mannosaminyltransferase